MSRRARAAWRASPVLARDGLFAGLLTLALVVDAVGSTDRPSPAVIALMVVSTASLTWRRAAPLTVLCLTGVAFGVATVLEGVSSGLLPAALVGVYSAIAWGRRGAGTIAAAAEMACVGLVVGIRTGDWTDEDVVVVSALLAIVVAAGLAVESRRTALAVARDRAERAEESREIEAARRVAEERLRIARELHDVLGHHVAVIGVQSGVAEMLLRSDPDGAQTALGHVQDATASVLTELGVLVEVLREPGEMVPDAPAPGLAALDRLLAEVRATGLDVDAHVSGAERRLAPVVDLAAYRVVQEALTNAHKHGRGRARLEVGWGAEALTLDVTNAVRPGSTADPRPAGGHGLVGMRERVESLGGAFVAGSDGGTYRVSVTLPALALPTGPSEVAR